MYAHTGELIVWSTGTEGDPLITSSGLAKAGHREPVAEVSVGQLLLLLLA